MRPEKTLIKLFLHLFILIIAVSAYGDRVPSPSGDHPGLKSRPSGTYQKRSLETLQAGLFPPVERLDLLVVMVEFSDSIFAPGHDRAFYLNELRHLEEYFTGASNGRFDLEFTLADDIVPLGFPEEYYGDDEAWELRMAEMMMTVVDSLDPSMDFSLFDAFALIHADPGEESDFYGDSPWQIWSGFLDPGEMAEALADTLGTPGIPTDDTTGPSVEFFIDNLLVFPEESTQDGYTFGSLGVYAYQIGLRLGMIPLFDTEPSGYPDSQGIGAFGLMGYGLYNAAGFIPAFPCAFHRYLMGWVEAVEIGSGGYLNMTDINSHAPGDTALVKIPLSETEYFLVANRLHDSDMDGRFDFTDINGNGIPENEDGLLGAEFDFYLTSTSDPFEYVDGVKITDTGGGIKIWHIDEAVIARRILGGDYPNDERYLKGVDLEEADGVQDMDRPGGGYAFGSYFDSYRGEASDRFASDTNPSSARNSGIGSGVDIRVISGREEVMRLLLTVEPGVESVSCEIEGNVSGLSPLVAYIYGDYSPYLLLPSIYEGGSDIYMVHDASDPYWSGTAELAVRIDDVTWAGPPIMCDLDGDLVPEIVATSIEGNIHAFHQDGSPYVIDTDGTPGTLSIVDSVISAPMLVNMGGDPYDEALVLASDGDSIYMYMVGSVLGPSDQRYFAPGVARWTLAEGTLRSNPCRGFMGESDPVLNGFFYAGEGPEGGLFLSYVYLSIVEGLGAVRSRTFDGRCVYSGLPYPVSGDIDRDGHDEMVIAFDKAGVIYYDPFDADGNYFPEPSPGDRLTITGLATDNPSPCSLSDLDGDGILDTVVRDSGSIYLLTGMGIIVRGWPVNIPEQLTAFEADTAAFAQPLAARLDGDSGLEILVNAGGESLAYEIDGKVVQGWPIPGDRDETVTPAIIGGPYQEVYIFTAGTSSRMGSTGINGASIDSWHSTLTRWNPGITDTLDSGWLFFRRDQGGSGRQEAPASTVQPQGFVDEKSFITYPNPAWGASVRIRVDISGRAQVTARVLTIEGEEVLSARGTHDWPEGDVPFEMELDISDVRSGVYICCLEVRGPGGVWEGARKFAISR